MNDAVNIMPKGDDDVQMGMMEMAAKKMKDTVKGGTAVIDWPAVNKIFKKTEREKLLENITATVLQTRGKVSTAVLDKYVNSENRENYIKSAVVNLMATPEYQLC